MNKIPTFLSILFAISLVNINAQIFKDTSKKVVFEWNGFMDVFSSYSNERIPLNVWEPWNNYTDEIHPNLVSHNRRKGIHINQALIQGSFSYDRFKVNLGVHGGTYVNDNYRDESIKYFSEANILIDLDKQKKIDLQVGIMPSHIGYENAISMDNWTLTRSVMADNSPYFMTGAKLNWKVKKWQLAGLVLNGWQKIQFDPYEKLPAFGWQIQRNGEKFIFNSSAYLEWRKMENWSGPVWFHNFYVKWLINEKNGLIFAVDYGQQQVKNDIGQKNFGGASLVFRHDWSPKWISAIRGEFYSGNELRMPRIYEQWRTTLGGSTNVDFKFHKHLWFRADLRYLNVLNLNEKDSHFLQFTVSAAVRI